MSAHTVSGAFIGMKHNKSNMRMVSKFQFWFILILILSNIFLCFIIFVLMASIKYKVYMSQKYYLEKFLKECIEI
jgi:putative effector of murein hydrolase